MMDDDQRFLSDRFCRKCEKITVYKHNRRLHHSECIECGGRTSVRLEIYFQIKKVVEKSSLIEKKEK